MAREMVIAPKTMSHIIKQGLGPGAFKQEIGYRLTIALKKNRKKKIKMPVVIVW